MTGPFCSTMHPLARRPWLLLPFLGSVLFLALGCSDQTTEPASTIQGSAQVVRIPRAGATQRYSSTAAPYRVSASVATRAGVSASVVTNGPSVLVLADTDVVATTALATSLANGGAQVTVRPAPEYTWDGTNPSLTGFDVVVHLNGATFDYQLSPEAQTALTDFVANGGGFVGSKWDGYETQPQMSELVLMGYSGDPDGPSMSCTACQVTYQQTAAGAGHPVLQGLPASFSFTADAHDAGPAQNSPTVLMTVPNGGPAVLVRQYGSGRVVNFSIAPNYQWDENTGLPHDPVTLQDANIQQLYLNAVLWAAGSGSSTTQPQSITFGSITDRVYGDPAFNLNATASSGLPVNYTASGTCTVVGISVSITGAGSCTITAHQAGNDSYEPAADVSQSFTIAKAPATISLSGLSSTYDGYAQSATATTSPAGLSQVTVTYSQGGVSVSPVAAGSYQVAAVLDNPNYAAPQANGTLTIAPATPTITWTPAAISAGTALGDAQLNAVVHGVGGAILSGGKTYTPGAGTMMSAGPATLSVDFAGNGNYRSASKSVTITVLSGMTFAGFYSPVKNMPMMNVATAGSSIPMKFSIGGFRGLQIFGAAPTSEAVTCSSAGESTISGTLAPSGLTAQGFSYTYVWKTSPGWAGSCRKFVLTLADGSRHEALFRFPSKASSVGRRIVTRGR